MTDPITPLTPQQEFAQEQRAEHEGYLHRVAEEIDVAANVIAGGHQDETISSRLARADVEDHGIGKEVGKVGSAILDVFQSDHGAKAEAADLERAKVVENLEESSGTLPE